jgi:hypothetical protein
MMLTRRSLLRSGARAFLLGPLLAVAGCGSGDFLSPLTVSPSTITPNGKGVNDEAKISYRLTRRADVSAMLISADGKTKYVLRQPQTRTPDDYEIRFDGAVPVPGKDWLRVVPNGTYQVVIQAKDATGQTITRQAVLTVKDADTTPPEITDVSVQYTTFSPNGDGEQDTTNIGYKLTKKAEVRVYATDAKGGFYLIRAPKKLDASLQSFTWDGTQNGGNVLADGKYNIHIEATDAAGNYTDYVTPVTIANGGTPRAEISSVRFSPLAIAVGGDIHVQITVKNTGTVPLKTLGPPSGTKYTTEESYASFVGPDKVPLYYERGGVWRACVGWQNEAQNYPIRWGFFSDQDIKKGRELMPGEEVVVTGTITIGNSMKSINAQRFFAALEQGSVGFPTGQVGQTVITIGY